MSWYVYPMLRLFVAFFSNNFSSLKLSLVDELYGIDSATLTHETFICTEMRESAQVLLDSYVRLQGLHISQVTLTLQMS